MSLVDGDGIEWQVVEGPEPQEYYNLQDAVDEFKDEYVARRVANPSEDEGESWTAVLTAHGWPPVLVQRADGLGDGWYRLYHWNPENGFMTRFLERPNRQFYEREKQIAQSQGDTAMANRIQENIDAFDAVRGSRSVVDVREIAQQRSRGR